MLMTIESYKSLLNYFTESGYSLIPLGEVTNVEPQGQILMRHDVDFDVHKSLKMAKAEQEIGARSSYYFLLGSQSYNLLDSETQAQIQEIADLGHDIDLHFDPSQYSDISSGLMREIELFKSMLGLDVNCITLHRPAEEFLTGDAYFCGVAHSYQEKYFKNIAYFSDSGGSFRFGLPQDSDTFAQGSTFQLLTHPIWWATDGATEVDKLANFLKERTEGFSDHMVRNCKPWKRHIEGDVDA